MPDGKKGSRNKKSTTITPRGSNSRRKNVETYLDTKDALGSDKAADILSSSFEEARDILSSHKKKKKGPSFLERYK